MAVRTEDYPQLLRDTRDTARYLGVSESTLEKWRMTPGAGPAFHRIGTRAVRYSQKDLDSFIDGRRCRSTHDGI